MRPKAFLLLLLFFSSSFVVPVTAHDTPSPETHPGSSKGTGPSGSQSFSTQNSDSGIENPLDSDEAPSHDSNSPVLSLGVTLIPPPNNPHSNFMHPSPTPTDSEGVGELPGPSHSTSSSGETSNNSFDNDDTTTSSQQQEESYSSGLNTSPANSPTLLNTQNYAGEFTPITSPTPDSAPDDPFANLIPPDQVPSGSIPTTSQTFDSDPDAPLLSGDTSPYQRPSQSEVPPAEKRRCLESQGAAPNTDPGASSNFASHPESSGDFSGDANPSPQPNILSPTAGTSGSAPPTDAGYIPDGAPSLMPAFLDAQGGVPPYFSGPNDGVGNFAYGGGYPPTSFPAPRAELWNHLPYYYAASLPAPQFFAPPCFNQSAAQSGQPNKCIIKISGTQIGELTVSTNDNMTTYTLHMLQTGNAVTTHPNPETLSAVAQNLYQTFYSLHQLAQQYGAFDLQVQVTAGSTGSILNLSSNLNLNCNQYNTSSDAQDIMTQLNASASPGNIFATGIYAGPLLINPLAFAMHQLSSAQPQIFQPLFHGVSPDPILSASITSQAQHQGAGGITFINDQSNSFGILNLDAPTDVFAGTMIYIQNNSQAHHPWLEVIRENAPQFTAMMLMLLINASSAKKT